MNLHQKQIRNS